MISVRTASFATMVAVASIFASTAAAQLDSSSVIDTGFLSGVGPSPRGVPLEQPYFLGWSTVVAPHEAGTRVAAEFGGLAVDHVNRWVYAATHTGRLTCLDAGKTIWSVDLGAPPVAAPVLFEQSVFVGTSEGSLFVFNKVTGEKRSRAVLGEELVTAPVVVRDGTVVRVYVGSSAESLFAVDPELGQKIWRSKRDAPSGFSIRGFARPVVLGGLVFAGFADGWVQGLDAVTGAVKWEKRVSPPGDQVDVDALAVNDSAVFVASYTGGLYALEPQSGATKWRTALPGASRLKVDGSLLYAGAPGVLAAYRVGDGKPAWRFKLEHPHIVSTPTVVEGLLVFSELEGPMWFVDGLSGAPVGRFDLGSGFDTAPISTGNALFALSNGGRVYSFGVVP